MVLVSYGAKIVIYFELPNLFLIIGYFIYIFELFVIFISMGKKRTTTEFIELCNIKHNNKYDYCKTIYTIKDNKVIIICPIHGEFEQIAHNHLKGSNCPTCSFNKRGFEKRLNNDVFINIATKIHKNKYDYSNVVYINASTKIKIICPIHGEFEQEPKAHTTLKQGCPNCFNEIRKNNAPSWLKENWVLAGQNSITFDSFKLYVIKCYNDTETFYKVGRTYNKLYRRFSQIPYKVEVLKVISSIDGGYIFELEKRLKRKYKHLKYIPSINFGGKHECFKPSQNII